MNNFAISSGGIGEALKRSASALYSANNTLDESIALITSANEVVQNPETVGQAYKTIALRIRGAKSELEDAGLETDGLIESTSKLREEVLALSGVDIMEADGQTFKSTYDVLDELSKVYDDLSDISQANLLEIFAGKRQSNILAATLSNFDTARDALETSLNSSGSAMREHEKWQQSLEAQINKLKASWQGLSQAFLSSDFLHGALDAVIGLVDGLTKLMNTVGTLPTLLGAVAAGFSLFKNKGLFTFDKDAKSIQLLGNGLTDLKGKYAQIQTAIGRYNSLSSKSASFQEKYNKAMAGSSTSMGKYLSGLKGAKASFGGYIGSLVGATIKTIALEAATMALNAALTMGISFAIQLIVEAFDKLIVTSDELAEKVDELVSKFQEEHKALKDMKGDFDTDNESSMISKYEKLSKGVDGLGRNVSLTSEEYSEYQSIVNSIAEQIPSLVSGYDEQGNALLSVKGNVEALTEAYEKLIHAQNQEILTNTGDIEKDFANTLEKASGKHWWSNGHGFGAGLVEHLSAGHGGVLGEIDSNYSSLFSRWFDYELKNDTVQGIQDLLSTKNDKEKDAILKKLESDRYATEEIRDALTSAGVDIGAWESPLEALEKTLEDDPQKVKNIIGNYYEQFAEAVEEQKTIATAKLSEAFDVSSAISGLNYGNISEELQAVAYQVVNSFDYDFLSKLSESGKTVEQWTTEMLDQLNSLSAEDNKVIETGFELQTKFNGGDISYGQYISQLQKTVDFIDKDLNVPDEVKNQIKLSLNSEDLLADYNALVHDLKNIGFDDTSVNKFLSSLSAEEYSAAMNIVPKLDTGTTIEDIQALIDEQLATEFTFDITAQTEGLELFNAALTESRSAAGLTSESIASLKARYEDLEGFNAAALFENTANGIHLNNEELSRLEEQYASTNKLNIEKNLNKVIEKYNKLTEEIKACTDAEEKESLQLQADTYKDKIDELSTLASQYDGLTSAFSKWQTALEGAEEGDNYDSLYENLESIKELYDKGLVGTDKFKTAAQLMTSKDLSNADIDEIISAYEKGYPKMQRYFTEGQKGCKNFLNDVQNLNSEWAHLNKDGSWEINFNTEEVAKELGVSVDFVLQIAKKLKDYGFEVNLEDSSVENLQTKIEKTEAKLKELGQSPVDINVDIEANSENIGTIESEIEKAKSKISEINNSSVEPNIKTAQLEDAQAKLESLIDKKIEASQPAYMNLNTSQVNASLVDALEKVQSYQEAINEVNKLSELKEAGIAIDDSELKTAKEKVDECAKAIQGLDSDVKMSIGLEEDGSIESIKQAFEDGKIKIDANTDPALTKIEQLAENVERVEDKDVTINVTVNGLDKVKELNKQIDLATDIDGDIDKLNDYVKAAQVLNKLGDNIASYISANIKGNVIETPEFKINNLKVFADSIKGLKDIGSFTLSAKVDIKGNVIETPEYKLNNLKVFTDSVKNLDDIGNVKSNVVANIEGNVIDEFEYKINNLKVFTDNAKDIDNIGNVKSKVVANIDGNVIDTSEYKINNIKTFVDNAKDIDKMGNVDSKVTADVDGNVIDKFEYKLNNLKVFTDSVKDIKNIGTVTSKVTADVEGNVIDKFEYKLDNLKVFADSSKDIKNIGNVVSKVEANVNGNVIDKFEYKLNNLKVFADSVKNIKNVGTVKTDIEANVDGNIIDTFEYKINNLKTFTDSAKDIKGIGTVTSKVTADVEGNVIDTREGKIDNLKVYYNSAKDISKIGNVKSSVNANISGNVINTKEYKIDNLEEYTNSAKNVKNIGNVTSKVSANVDGNVIDTKEYKIDNLKVYTDSAKKVKDIGTVTSSVTANVDGNVIKTKEYKIDNLDLFGESAKKVKSIGTVNSDVTANVNGNVINTFEEKLDNLEVFANGANKLKNTGNFTSSVSANVNGNVVTDDTIITDLEHFVSVVNGLPAQTATVTVTANVDSANINSAITLLQSVSDSGLFKNYSATVQVGAKVTKIDDTTVQNYIATEKFANGKVKWANDETLVNQFKQKIHEATGQVKWDDNTDNLKKSFTANGTVTWTSGNNVKVNVVSNANGTAHANGTTGGRAFARGNWGIKGNGVALGGELGRRYCDHT